MSCSPHIGHHIRKLRVTIRSLFQFPPAGTALDEKLPVNTLSHSSFLPQIYKQQPLCSFYSTMGSINKLLLWAKGAALL